MRPKSFVFLTIYSLWSQAIRNANISKRFIKWVTELQEFQYGFLVEESTRATLANILTYREQPTCIKEKDLPISKEESIEIDNAFVLFFDGSYKKSLGEATRGIVILNSHGYLIHKEGLKLSVHSNNESEYEALWRGLQICLQMGIIRLYI